jgi:hypothetical protein
MAIPGGYRRVLDASWGAAVRLIPPVGAVLFLLTGLSKSMDIAGFESAVRAQRVIPAAWAHWGAIGAAAAECLVGGMTLFLLMHGGRAGRFAGWLPTLLAAGLTGYVVTLWLHPPPKPAPCACGLAPSDLVTDWSVLVRRDAALTAMLLCGAAFAPVRAPARLDLSEGVTAGVNSADAPSAEL